MVVSKSLCSLIVLEAIFKIKFEGQNVLESFVLFALLKYFTQNSFAKVISLERESFSIENTGE